MRRMCHRNVTPSMAMGNPKELRLSAMGHISEGGPVPDADGACGEGSPSRNDPSDETSRPAVPGRFRSDPATTFGHGDRRRESLSLDEPHLLRATQTVRIGSQ